MTPAGWIEPRWRRSSHSGGGNDCVEIAVLGPATTVRDSKNPAGPRLSFAGPAWTVFLDRTRADL